MDIIGAIKKVVADYLQNESLCNMVYATYTGVGLKIDNKPISIPADMVNIPLHLKEGAYAIKSGDRVIVIQSQGGQRYAIVGRL